MGIIEIATWSYNAGAPHLGCIRTSVCYHNTGAPHLTMIVVGGWRLVAYMARITNLRQRGRENKRFGRIG